MLSVSADSWLRAGTIQKSDRMVVRLNACGVVSLSFRQPCLDSAIGRSGGCHLHVLETQILRSSWKQMSATW